jgi:3-dehydrotetronate 4-kinase
MVWGAIADDFTGATDLANNLTRAGMRTVVVVGVPHGEEEIAADAVVIALKSRTIPAQEAIEQSIAACRWLRRKGASHIYFKICSTFDSTPHGNIGPVASALMEELKVRFSIVCPAFPDNERFVFQGYLFTGEVLLSEGSMRNHPLTPMSDANLVRVLQAQLFLSERVGLVNHRYVGASTEAISRCIAELRSQELSLAIADATTQGDLERLAEALKDDLLITGSSGLGQTLPAVYGFRPSASVSQLPAAGGRAAILSGSCSSATNAQVRYFLAQGGEAFPLDPDAIVEDPAGQINSALAWADSVAASDPSRSILIYSTADPATVKTVQLRLGAAKIGHLVEECLASIARGLVSGGVGRLIVAGGETAGVCVRNLDIRRLAIGPQIDPGVPWCYASSAVSSQGGLHVALKSGNFGSEDFFIRAFTFLEETQS